MSPEKNTKKHTRRLTMFCLFSKSILMMMTPAAIAIIFSCLFFCLDGNAAEKQDTAATVAQMYQQYKAHFPEISDLTPEAVMNTTNRTAFVLVDVRNMKEMAVSMIPGAITRQQFERAPKQYSGRKIVTYCTIGYRSGLYAKKLQKQGWEVYNLTGSILGWVHVGGHVEHEGVITKRVHVYGKKWDLLPTGYESVK